MDYGKKEASWVSEVIGCALLFSMTLFLLMSLGLNRSLTANGIVIRALLHFAVFMVPAALGVWKLRRSAVRFPASEQKASLNKKLAVMLSTFGLLVIFRILYTSVFSSTAAVFGVSAAEDPVQLFMIFVFSTLIPSAAEEIFFRGFLLRSMRIFRASLAVLMSALTFALMHFSANGFPLYFISGLFMGMAYVATNSLSTAIAIRFLCNAFWFLAETVEFYAPDQSMLLMQGGLLFCILLSASGLPYLRENMRIFFENDDEKAIPSAYFWTVQTALFVALAAGIQLLFHIN